MIMMLILLLMKIFSDCEQLFAPQTLHFSTSFTQPNRCSFLPSSVFSSLSSCHHEHNHYRKILKSSFHLKSITSSSGCPWKDDCQEYSTAPWLSPGKRFVKRETKYIHKRVYKFTSWLLTAKTFSVAAPYCPFCKWATSQDRATFWGGICPNFDWCFIITSWFISCDNQIARCCHLLQKNVPRIGKRWLLVMGSRQI